MNKKQTEICKKSQEHMQCYLLPMPEYEEKIAAFVVLSGSNDITFLENNSEKPIGFPLGVAHFIEHKLFRQKWGDAFVQFGKWGALANAFTDGEKTVYYFSCRQNFEKNLQLLLEFVGETYFLPEEVQAEKSIIQREIQMYDDNPDWIGYYQMLSAMYIHHPIGNPIAGTIDSVEEISTQVLQKAYDCLYTSNRFSLVCGGNIPTETILRMIKQMKTTKKRGKTVFQQEPNFVKESYVERTLGLEEIQFQIGCKMPLPENLAKRKLEMMFFLELLLGETSDFYSEAYEEKIIEESLGCAYLQGREYAFFACTGKGECGREVLELMKKWWRLLQKDGVDEEKFLRIRKKLVGGWLRKEQSVERMVFSQVDFIPEKKTLAEVKGLLEEISKEDIEKLLQYDPFPDKMILSVIR